MCWLTRTILKLTSTGRIHSFPSIFTTTGGKELAMAPAERDRLPPGSVVMYAATQSESPVEERGRERQRGTATLREGTRLCGSITFLSRSIRTYGHAWKGSKVAEMSRVASNPRALRLVSKWRRVLRSRYLHIWRPPNPPSPLASSLKPEVS